MSFDWSVYTPEHTKERLARFEKKIWKTGQGKEIPYGEIEDGHLLNILMWMRRKAHQCAWEKQMLFPTPRQLVDWKDFVPPEWDALIAEAMGRNPKLALAAANVNQVSLIDEKELRTPFMQNYPTKFRKKRE